MTIQAISTNIINETIFASFDNLLHMGDQEYSHHAIYAGLFLTEASKLQLLNDFPAKFNSTRAHHVTMAFAPTRYELQQYIQPLMGKVHKIRVLFPLENEQAQIVTILADEQIWFRKKQVPQITISIPRNGRAVHGHVLAREVIASHTNRMHDELTIREKMMSFYQKLNLASPPYKNSLTKKEPLILEAVVGVAITNGPPPSPLIEVTSTEDVDRLLFNTQSVQECKSSKSDN